VTSMRFVVLALALAVAAEAETVKVIEDFEQPKGEGWEQAADAPVGKGAGATPNVFTKWGGLGLRVEGVPDDADGISFWIRTDDGLTAALTLGLYEWDEKQEMEALGWRLWATPTWQHYTFPLAGAKHVWARKGDGKLDRRAVRTVRFQRLLWTGGFASARVVFDQVEFVRGATGTAIERKPSETAIAVNAGRTVARTKRFWRAISVADTVEQNTHFQGPEGGAMRIIGADRTFDYARIAWHVNRHSSAWVKYDYGKPLYTEDAAGKPLYDFSGQDAVIENIRKCNLHPMVLLHCIPREIAAEPPADERRGTASPPADYAKWRALVKAVVQHYVEKYSAEEVAQWYWEIWNEPDLWWHNWKLKGKHAGYDEYFRLYDHAAAAIREALPEGRIGGPAVAGYPRDYPMQLLRHAVEGKNAVTGQAGAPLTFLSHHAYDGAFGQMIKLDEARSILAKYAKERPFEVQVTEYGNAIWGHEHAGRYQAASLCQMIDACLYAARQDATRVDGLYWFGVMRSFGGDCDAFFTAPHAKARQQITTLFLHVKGTVLAKPVYNAYRMLNYLDTNCLEVSGAHLGEDVHAIATLSDDARRLTALLYRHDAANPTTKGAARKVELRIDNLPFDGKAGLREFRIDSSHSDVYAAWEAEGSPSHAAITADQVKRIKAHDPLETARPEQAVTLTKGGTWNTSVELDPHAIALLVLTAGK